MGYHKGHFTGRYACILRDGKLFAGSVPVHCGDHLRRLDDETIEALNLSHHARLHNCAVCSSYYIAHHAARTCSSQCRKVETAKAQAKVTKKRSDYRKWCRENPEGRRCARCNNWHEHGQRNSSKYCSAACRQAAYRSRHREATTEAQKQKPRPTP